MFNAVFFPFKLTHQPENPSLWVSDVPVPGSSRVLLGDLNPDRYVSLFLTNGHICTHAHTCSTFRAKLIHDIFQEMEALEVHLSYSAFFSPPECQIEWRYFIHVNISGASFEAATCLKIWRSCYRNYSEKPNHISLLSNRMARVLQLCSLVWVQPEPPHRAGALVRRSVCFYSDRWGCVRRMWCSCGLIF